MLPARGRLCSGRASGGEAYGTCALDQVAIEREGKYDTEPDPSRRQGGDYERKPGDLARLLTYRSSYRSSPKGCFHIRRLGLVWGFEVLVRRFEVNVHGGATPSQPYSLTGSRQRSGLHPRSRQDFVERLPRGTQIARLQLQRRVCAACCNAANRARPLKGFCSTTASLHTGCASTA